MESHIFLFSISACDSCSTKYSGESQTKILSQNLFARSAFCLQVLQYRVQRQLVSENFCSKSVRPSRFLFASFAVQSTAATCKQKFLLKIRSPDRLSVRNLLSLLIYDQNSFARAFFATHAQKRDQVLKV